MVLSFLYWWIVHISMMMMMIMIRIFDFKIFMMNRNEFCFTFHYSSIIMNVKNRFDDRIKFNYQMSKRQFFLLCFILHFSFFGFLIFIVLLHLFFCCSIFVFFSCLVLRFIIRKQIKIFFRTNWMNKNKIKIISFFTFEIYDTWHIQNEQMRIIWIFLKI